MNRKTRIALLLLILVIGAAFRLLDLHTIPPGLFPDEAMNGNNLHEALGTGDFKVFYKENNGREGFFINLQSLSVLAFGHTAFALRFASALFGIATILALYLFSRAYFRNDRIALLAAFFIATGFWHIMFSRIGFRAIMAPFFLTAGLWGIYRAYDLRHDTKHWRPLAISALGGILFGLGFHSYIAYRAAPILLLPIFWLFVKEARTHRNACIVCVPAIFVLMALLTTIPLLLYFTEYPQDFFGRTSQISIFSSPNPLAALATNIVKTIGMFYVAGDFNWRHNYAGHPTLWWPLAIFFTIGIAESIRKRYALILMWMFVMMLPVLISSEGIPHALRAIILIPPTFILVAVGFDLVWQAILAWLKKAEVTHSEASSIIKRIRAWTSVLAIVFLGTSMAYTFNLYFQKWAVRPHVADAFEKDLYTTGVLIARQPDSLPKYVIVSEVDSIDISGRPMALQPILFATRTYRPDPPGAHGVWYLTAQELDRVICNPDCMIFPLSNFHKIGDKLKERIPNLKAKSEDGILFFAPQQ